MKKQLFYLITLALFISCNNKKEPIIITSNDFHKSVDKVGEVMVHDIFHHLLQVEFLHTQVLQPTKLSLKIIAIICH